MIRSKEDNLKFKLSDLLYTPVVMNTTIWKDNSLPTVSALPTVHRTLPTTSALPTVHWTLPTTSVANCTLYTSAIQTVQYSTHVLQTVQVWLETFKRMFLFYYLYVISYCKYFFFILKPFLCDKIQDTHMFAFSSEIILLLFFVQCFRKIQNDQMLQKFEN